MNLLLLLWDNSNIRPGHYVDINHVYNEDLVLYEYYNYIELC